MIVDKKKTDINELSLQIAASINKANRKMAEDAAANNESLIVGDKNGGFKSVPAKDLLKDLPE